MLRSATLTAFVATAHPARAKTFYERALGLRLITDDEFALAFDSNGTQLRVQKVPKVEPPPFTVLGWQVPNIREAVTGMVRRGVIFERFSSLAQDAAGIWHAPSGAQVAWFKDPDGNLLSLAEIPAPEGVGRREGTSR
ncbi:MAG TPA: VOC family protein [Gemmatimonadales bacterium]|nr:VOC family protein [Gemmatimonadales bacterium]